MRVESPHYTCRENALCEQIDYNLLFRWFVGLGMDDAMWNHAVFSKNRDRLLNATLAYLGHALVENRNGLIAQAMVTQADGFAEREAALLMLQAQQQGRTRRITVGAGKAYESKDFVTAARALNVTPHITTNDKGRRSNMDRRTTRHPGYAISLSRRWLVEKIFGWNKQTGPIGRIKLRGLHLVDAAYVFGCPR